MDPMYLKYLIFMTSPSDYLDSKSQNAMIPKNTGCGFRLMFMFKVD